jgi:hypothetical protein
LGEYLHIILSNFSPVIVHQVSIFIKSWFSMLAPDSNIFIISKTLQTSSFNRYLQDYFLLECLPNMHKALGSLPSTVTKQKQAKSKNSK